MDNPIKQELNHKDHDSPPTKLPSPAPTPTTAAVSDRMKRDEWSEGAVFSLLDAYEAKWMLRNRAKLKGHDWEDVANYVSSRANSSKSPKTQTQCKNKIESMKKRYRSESATTDVSSWPLFPRLDRLLRGSGGAPGRTAAVSNADPLSSSIPLSNNHPPLGFDHAPPPPPPPPPSPPIIHSSSMPGNVSAPAPVSTPVHQGTGQNSADSNGVDRENKEEEEVVVTKTVTPEHQEMETDCSTPALYSNENEKTQTKNHKTKITDNRKRRRKGENLDVAESIRWLAKVVMRSEQAKAETLREVEKMRADAEVRRGELDLKRTEIIAQTQLEIARLFAACLEKAVDPSLRIGPN